MWLPLYLLNACIRALFRIKHDFRFLNTKSSDSKTVIDWICLGLLSVRKYGPARTSLCHFPTPFPYVRPSHAFSQYVHGVTWQLTLLFDRWYPILSCYFILSKIGLVILDRIVLYTSSRRKRILHWNGTFCTWWFDMFKVVTPAWQ